MFLLITFTWNLSKPTFLTAAVLTLPCVAIIICLTRIGSYRRTTHLHTDWIMLIMSNLLSTVPKCQTGFTLTNMFCTCRLNLNLCVYFKGANKVHIWKTVLQVHDNFLQASNVSKIWTWRFKHKIVQLMQNFSTNTKPSFKLTKRLELIAIVVHRNSLYGYKTKTRLIVKLVNCCIHSQLQ